MNDLRNRVQLIGNLGMDPEMVTFENGKKLSKFSLATSQTYYDTKGEKTTETQWHNLVAWDKLAERVQKLLKKGSMVAVDGRLVYRTYDSKEGQKRYITEIVLSNLEILQKKKELQEA